MLAQEAKGTLKQGVLFPTAKVKKMLTAQDPADDETQQNLVHGEQQLRALRPNKICTPGAF